MQAMIVWVPASKHVARFAGFKTLEHGYRCGRHIGTIKGNRLFFPTYVCYGDSPHGVVASLPACETVEEARAAIERAVTEGKPIHAEERA